MKEHHPKIAETVHPLKTGSAEGSWAAMTTSRPAGGMQMEKETLTRRWATPSDGLCLTCNNASHCQYRAARGNALLFCEMFDSYIEPVRRGNGDGMRLSDNPTAQLADSPETTSRDAGLCVNCRHLEHCMHPRPAGGIWHCEDYE